jgi:hypothetical protein
VAEDAEDDETDDEENLADFDSSPSLSDGDVASLLTSIADFRSDVSNAEEESDFFSFLTELERVDSDCAFFSVFFLNARGRCNAICRASGRVSVPRWAFEVNNRISFRDWRVC